MPIRQDDNQPNRRFGIINLVLIGFGVLLLVSSFIPSNGMQQVPRVPYSLFIDQVNDGAVKRAFITQDQIRYELSAPEEGTPPVLATTPIFDMDLPQRLEAKGVEFAAAPPKKPNIFTTILSWVVPPLIFILVRGPEPRRAGEPQAGPRLQQMVRLLVPLGRDGPHHDRAAAVRVLACLQR